MVFNYIKAGYQALKNVFLKTGSLLGSKLRTLFQKEIDEETLESLEEVLYQSDLGVKLAVELTEKIRALHYKNPKYTSEDYIEEIKKEIAKQLDKKNHSLIDSSTLSTPAVILVVGVNGSGKTTSIAKIAHILQNNGKKVLLAAADTFRAAAIEQLATWAERLNIDIVKGNPGSDPAAVAFDALTAAKARQCDYVIIDTAGRLHNKTHLMQELEKVKRTCNKVIENAPHEILLIIDANTGQNGIDQAKTFHQFTPLTGLILTKLDGSAKGGIIVAAQNEINVPVKFIGVGEGIEDLKEFDTNSYINALFD